MKMRTYWENERRKLLGQPLIQDTDNQENTAIDAPLGAVLAQGGGQQAEIKEKLFFQKSYKIAFDAQGKIIERVETPNEAGQAYIRKYISYGNGLFVTPVDVAIPMPKIIDGYEHPRYQVYDYWIAIESHFLNTKITKLREERDALPPSADGYTKLQNTYFIHTKQEHTFRKRSTLPGVFDPTLLKAMMIQETGGTFTSTKFDIENEDILGSNFYASETQTDWAEEKMLLGLKKGKGADPITSIRAAIHMLCWKGNISIRYIQQQDGREAYFFNWKSGENGNWLDFAVDGYNKNPKINYQGSVTARFNSAKLPQAINF